VLNKIMFVSIVSIAACAVAACTGTPSNSVPVTSDVTGIVTEHEYHPADPGRPAVAARPASGCRYVTSGKTRVWQCTVPAQPGTAAVPPTPEWWELEITTADGREIDIPVTKAVYDAYADGDYYPAAPPTPVAS
jgi:hypothetical protein